MIFWLQTALGGLSVLLTYFLLEETLPNMRATEFKGHGLIEASRQIWLWANPVTVVKLYGQQNLLFVVSYVALLRLETWPNWTRYSPLPLSCGTCIHS